MTGGKDGGGNSGVDGNPKQEGPAAAPGWTILGGGLVKTSTVQRMRSHFLHRRFKAHPLHTHAAHESPRIKEKHFYAITHSRPLNRAERR